MFGIEKIKLEVKELKLKYDVLEKIVSLAIMNKSQGNIQKEIILPLLQEKWDKQENEKGLRADDNIKTLGQQLVAMQKVLHDEMLIKEREGKDIAEIKGKIAILNLITGREL